MNEKPTPNTKTLTNVILASLLLLFAVVGWLVYRVENLPAPQTATIKTETKTSDQNDTGWNTTIKSGKGGFSVTVPDGWGPLVNATNGDSLRMAGTKQPNVATGNETKVVNAEAGGGDSLSLFTIVLLDKGGAAPPMGQASDFSFGKGDEEVKGKKYLYTYSQDELVGIGHQRFQGDRDYEYVFEVNGKELHVYYQVYGSDPRNLSTTVDEIVRTIRL